MPSKKTHPTLLEVAHEMAKDLYEANVINTTIMREFDALCLTPEKNKTIHKKELKKKSNKVK